MYERDAGDVEQLLCRGVTRYVEWTRWLENVAVSFSKPGKDSSWIAPMLIF